MESVNPIVQHDNNNIKGKDISNIVCIQFINSCGENSMIINLNLMKFILSIFRIEFPHD